MSEEILNSDVISEGTPEESQEQETNDSAELQSPEETTSTSNNALKEMIKELELTVNGKKIKKSINLSDEEALKREFQIAEANKAGMSKAAEYEKLFSQEMERIKSDPLEYAAKILGVDVEELAARRLEKVIEERKKTPEQVAREKEAQEIEKIRKENEELKKSAEEARFRAMQEQEARKFQDEMDSALEKYPALPKNSKLVTDKIIDVMLWAMDNGIKDVSVESVLPTVEAELMDVLNRHMDALPDEALEKYMGKKTSERLRQKRLADANKPKAPKVQATVPDISTPTNSGPRTKSNDFFRSLGKEKKS